MRGLTGIGRARRNGARLLGAFAACAATALGAPATTPAVTVGPLPSAGAPVLPDNRGYEQVTPVEKNFNSVAYSKGYNQLSVTGAAAAFTSGGAFAGVKGSPANVSYMASRGAAGGWLTQGLTPPQAPYVADFAKVWNSDATISKTLVDSSLALAPGASSEYGGFYLADNATGTYELIAPGSSEFQPGFFGSNIEADVGTADFSHVVFQSNGKIGAATQYLARVYDFSAGHLNVVSILPDGSTPAGPSMLGGNEGQNGRGYRIEQHAISRDGSRIFFSASAEESGPRQLYMRVNDSQTILISHPNPGVVDPNGTQPATFGTAASDGSAVYLVSTQKLTSDATAHPAENETPFKPASADLYRYDVASDSLTDLTTADPAGAHVNSVLGASDDGSYVYFNASGVLAPGATAGAENVYVLHSGVTRFVGLAPSGASAGNFHAGEDSRVTPDGLHVTFLSDIQTTSYDNAGQTEYYIYDYPADELRCISCNPSGLSPHYGNTMTQFQFGGSFPEREYAPLALGDDGQRFFFTSEEALVPADTNGIDDAYEWEDGRLYPLSTGTSAERSFFADSTPKGDDVTILTEQSLLQRDGDTNYDVYDVRVDGGEPASLAPPACTGTGCQGVPATPPIFATPSSATFNGIGNLAPRPKSTRSKAKPKKHKAKPKKHKPTPRHKHAGHKSSAKDGHKSSAKAGHKASARKAGENTATKTTTTSSTQIGR